MLFDDLDDLRPSCKLALALGLQAQHFRMNEKAAYWAFYIMAMEANKALSLTRNKLLSFSPAMAHSSPINRGARAMGIINPRPAIRRGESRVIHYTLRELDRLTFWSTAINGLSREEASRRAAARIRDPKTTWTVVDNTGEIFKGFFATATRACESIRTLERTYGRTFSLRSHEGAQ